MLEGLFQQIANQIPPKVPSASSEKSTREPLQPRLYKPIPWVPPVRSERYKTQNTQPLSEQDRQKILDYLAAISETDQEIIQEILDICTSDNSKRLWLLQWAAKILPVPKIDLLDDRHYCRECAFMKNRRCQRHGFWPVDNIPRRCADFQFKKS
ncbi:hypothetical protein KEF85_14830 [Methylomonas paludis]|uniref:Uncharacterized protein n=1 Tax=Methylomonas paludis TaxID=1173101 RepID=A0A975MMG9_9GAMM|nr:hypothetical protein [Methylomonas paludis]QWF70583.1 hypothetical protein KEF85_14830 [Methylomonas paludis]